MKKFDMRTKVGKPNSNGVYILSDKTINEFMRHLDDLVYKVTHDGDYYVEVITERLNLLAVVDKNYMGEADKKLGKILLKGFLSNIRDISLKPEKILLYNEGVKIVNDPEFEAILASLSDTGVEILLCGTCVKYFEIEPKFGVQTNMFTIIGLQMNAQKVLRP